MLNKVREKNRRRERIHLILGLNILDLLQLKNTPTLPPPKTIKNDSKRICYALTTH
jgi:hypothetical protein